MSERDQLALEVEMSMQRRHGAGRVDKDSDWWWTYPRGLRRTVKNVLDELWKHEMYDSENY